MRESRTSGSVRGDRGNPVPYRYIGKFFDSRIWQANQRSLRRVFPAHAGMNRRRSAPCSSAMCSPRMRG